MICINDISTVEYIDGNREAIKHGLDVGLVYRDICRDIIKDYEK